jgi:hypothetical protein
LFSTLNDNVAKLLSEAGTAGKVAEAEFGARRWEVTLRQDVPLGHKFALRQLPDVKR